MTFYFWPQLLASIFSWRHSCSMRKNDDRFQSMADQMTSPWSSSMPGCCLSFFCYVYMAMLSMSHGQKTCFLICPWWEKERKKKEGKSIFLLFDRSLGLFKSRNKLGKSGCVQVVYIDRPHTIDSNKKIYSRLGEAFDDRIYLINSLFDIYFT